MLASNPASVGSGLAKTCCDSPTSEESDPIKLSEDKKHYEREDEYAIAKNEVVEENKRTEKRR